MGLATTLAVVAIVIAIIALALNFVVPGPTGAAGSSSSGGIPGVTLWAVVASSGSISRSVGTSSSYESAVGQYQVNFTQILYDCTYTAGLGTTSAGIQPAGSAAVATVASNSHALKVSTYNATGVATSNSFHLVAFCPGGMYAVVAANGTFVSGDGVVLTQQSGVGVYQVIFTVNVASCAYVGGLGQGGSTPAGSLTTATYGANNDGVWVDTYNSAGADTNEAFHLAVYC